MEHPLIPDLNNKTIDELGATLSELHQKLMIAYRSGNGHLCNQLRMAIESYQVVYLKKQQDAYNALDKGINFNNKIKIS